MIKSTSKKYFYLETYGCQMNKYDSELVAGILEQAGYLPAPAREDADIVLVNTCSVREHAEVRALGRLSALNELRKDRPHLILGILGCVAQRIGTQILAEKSFINLAVGPDDYRQLPLLLAQLAAHPGKQLVRTELSDFEDYADIYPSRVQGVSAWVAIMRGCNNFCAYCIVPYLRGRERSRPMRNILDEVRKLAAEGYKEVTLLGQNVNSYQTENLTFPDLLRAVSKISGIERIRFASSHPKDLSLRLIQTIAAEENICKHIHLAVQAGSNKILRLMNRQYTREHYLHVLEQARQLMPEVSFTTDIIVGFPGESEADFEETLDLVKQARFDNAFTFKYCPRAGTRAAQLPETVSEAEKQARLERLIALQDQITLEINRAQTGKVLPVLVEGPSKKSPFQYKGRTDTNKIVIFEKDSLRPGHLVPVKITAAEGHTLFGKPEAIN